MGAVHKREPSDYTQIILSTKSKGTAACTIIVPFSNRELGKHIAKHSSPVLVPAYTITTRFPIPVLPIGKRAKQLFQ